MDKIHAALGGVLNAAAVDGYTPADLATDLAGAGPQILGFIGVAVAAGIGVMLAVIGINRGLGTFSKTAKKG